MNSINLKYKQAFTLTEVLIVMALIAILGVGSARISLDFVAKQQIISDSNVVVGQLYLAQANAQNNKNSSSWGLNISGNNVTVFSGTNFGSRDTAYDNTQQIGSSTGKSGSTSIIFDAYSGIPTGSFNLTLANSQAAAIISVNQYGTISAT